METSKKPTSVTIQMSISPVHCKIWDQDGKQIPFVKEMQLTITHGIEMIPRATLTIMKIKKEELNSYFVVEPPKIIWRDIPVLKFTVI